MFESGFAGGCATHPVAAADELRHVASDLVVSQKFVSKLTSSKISLLFIFLFYTYLMLDLRSRLSSLIS